MKEKCYPLKLKISEMKGHILLLKENLNQNQPDIRYCGLLSSMIREKESEINDIIHIKWSEYQETNEVKLEVDMMESPICWEIASDGRIVRTFSGTIVIYDSQTGKIINKVREGRKDIVFLKEMPDGSFITGNNNSSFKLWGKDFQTFKQYNYNALISIGVGKVLNACKLESGKIVTKIASEALQIWDTNKKSRNLTIEKTKIYVPQDFIPLSGDRFIIVYSTQIYIYDPDNKNLEPIKFPTDPITNTMVTRNILTVASATGKQYKINLDNLEVNQDLFRVPGVSKENCCLTSDSEGYIYNVGTNLTFFDSYRNKINSDGGTIHSTILKIKETTDHRIIVMDRVNNIYTFELKDEK